MMHAIYNYFAVTAPPTNVSVVVVILIITLKNVPKSMHTTKMHASFMPVVKLYDLKFAMHSNAIMPEIAHVYIMLSAKMVN